MVEEERSELAGPEAQLAEARIIQRQYRMASAAALVLLGSGSIFYHFVEHFRWIDAVYFCTITLTTIGYGDLYPKTDAGKLFTIAYVLVGIGIIGYFVNILIKNAISKRAVRRSRKKAS
jgi:hypothetical protein